MVFEVHQKPFLPFGDYIFGFNFQIEGLAQKFTMFQCLKLHC